MKRFFTYIFATLCAAAVLQTSVVAQAPDKSRVWVQFAPGQKAAVQAALQRIGGEIHYEFDDLEAVAVTVPTQALQGLSRNPNVVLVEEDALRELYSTHSGPIPYGLDMVQARAAWEDSTGAGCKVCIIDSGLYNHSEFTGLTITGDGDPAGWNTDNNTHGTHVAGTVAGANVGVAPAVSLHIVKVFGDSGAWIYSSSLVEAARRCRDAGAQIINMSLGGSRALRTEQSAFDDLYKTGILSIAAAGNAGNNTKSYPASYSSVVSVAAIDENKIVAGFSQKNNQVELAAPGVAVLSSVGVIEKVLAEVAGQNSVEGYHIENAARGIATGSLVDGGRATSGSGDWFKKVVLVERGDISFYDKVRNVQNSGGVAAIIYNNEPGNFFGTLDTGNSSIIPAISISQENGHKLRVESPGSETTVTSTAVSGNGYAYYDGTSMATPHVSGVAALVWSSNLNLKNTEVRQALQVTAQDLGAAGKDNSYGYGLVQAAAAIGHVGGGGSPPPPPPPPPTADNVIVESVSYGRSGKNLVINVSLDPKVPATVSISVTNGKQTRVGTAETIDGVATFNWQNAPTGCYVTTVTQVSAPDHVWTGVTPKNNSCE